MSMPRVQLPELGFFYRLCSMEPCWAGTTHVELAVMKKILSDGPVFAHGVLVQVSLVILHHPECALSITTSSKHQFNENHHFIKIIERYITFLEN